MLKIPNVELSQRIADGKKIPLGEVQEMWRMALGDDFSSDELRLISESYEKAEEE